AAKISTSDASAPLMAHDGYSSKGSDGGPRERTRWQGRSTDASYPIRDGTAIISADWSCRRMSPFAPRNGVLSRSERRHYRRIARRAGSEKWERGGRRRGACNGLPRFPHHPLYSYLTVV